MFVYFIGFLVVFYRICAGFSFDFVSFTVGQFIAIAFLPQGFVSMFGKSLFCLNQTHASLFVFF